MCIVFAVYYQAAELGQLHELKRRLDSGEPVDRKDVYGKTPLHYSVRMGMVNFRSP